MEPSRLRRARPAGREDPARGSTHEVWGNGTDQRLEPKQLLVSRLAPLRVSNPLLACLAAPTPKGTSSMRRRCVVDPHFCTPHRSVVPAGAKNPFSFGRRRNCAAAAAPGANIYKCGKTRPRGLPVTNYLSQNEDLRLARRPLLPRGGHPGDLLQLRVQGKVRKRSARSRSTTTATVLTFLKILTWATTVDIFDGASTSAYRREEEPLSRPSMTWIDDRSWEGAAVLILIILCIHLKARIYYLSKKYPVAARYICCQTSFEYIPVQWNKEVFVLVPPRPADGTVTAVP